MIRFFFVNLHVGYKSSHSQVPNYVENPLEARLLISKLKFFSQKKKMTSQMLPVDFSNLFKTIMF